MIDEDRTIQLFGYTSDQLTPRSGKKIVTVCEECGRYRVVSKHDYKKLCNPCSRKGEYNPRWKGGQVAKVCEVCGGTFHVDRCDIDKRRTCSNKCYGKWRSENMRGENSSSWKEKVVKVCELCGNQFSVVPALSRQRFCSRECQGKWQSETQSGENNPCWKEKVIKVCELCGKEFSVIQSQSHRKFCSHECHNKWQLANRSGENSPSWKERVVKVCELCGKEFSVIPALSHQIFCSRKCMGKWQSENQCGENNPNFNKPLPLEARKRISATRQRIPYEEWESFAKDHPYCPKFNERCKESNREKYDRRCFLSGMTEEENGKKLSVHHIDMDKTQGCDGHTWKLVPLAMKLHSISHTQTWMARIQYLLNHVWTNMGAV